MTIFISIFFIIFLLAVQGILSGFETGVVSVNKFKLHQLAENKKHYNLINHFLLQVEKTLSTTLIGSNIAIIGSSTITTGLFLIINPHYGALLTTLCLTPVSIIFAELLPKAIFYRKSLTLSILFGPLVYFLYYMLYPLVFLANYITGFFLAFLGMNTQINTSYVSRDEIKSIFSHFFDQKSEENFRMVDKSMEITQLPIKQMMIPLVQVFACPEQITSKEFFDLLKDKKYTHIPVYSERIDHLIGVVNIFDVIDLDKNDFIKKIIQKPLIVPENKYAMELLIEFTRQNTQIALVADEFGGISGIVTLKDIWQYITGKMKDEAVNEEISSVQVKKDMMILDGKTKLTELGENYHIFLPKGDYETLNGLLITRFGRIPQIGEELVLDNWQVIILGASDRHVSKALLKKK